MFASTRHTHAGHGDFGSQMGRHPLVFLSYAHVDRKHPVFQRFVRDLKNDGRIRVWDGFDEISIGDSLLGRVREAIEEADFHLYIVTPDEAKGYYTNHEMHLAYAQQLRQERATIIPVLIDDRALPDMLESLVYVDLTKDYEDAFQRLMVRLVSASQQPLATFDLDTVDRDPSIIEVTGLVGTKLVEFFARYPDELKSMNRRKFEELVAELFSGLGYDVQLTQQTRDGGRDVIAIAKREV